jgi:hypothetical protein
MQEQMQRQREMGGWMEMQKKQAMEQARIPDRPPTGDPFADMEQQAAQLRALVSAGQITETMLEACLAELMIQDGKGRWWVPGAKSGQWYRYDGAKWVLDKPPRRGGLRFASQSRRSERSAAVAPSMPQATPATKPQWRRTLGALFSGLFVTLVALCVISGIFSEVGPTEGLLIGAAVILIGLVLTVRSVRKARKGE